MLGFRSPVAVIGLGCHSPGALFSSSVGRFCGSRLTKAPRGYLAVLLLTMVFLLLGEFDLVLVEVPALFSGKLSAHVARHLGFLWLQAASLRFAAP